MFYTLVWFFHSGQNASKQLAFKIVSLKLWIFNEVEKSWMLEGMNTIFEMKISRVIICWIEKKLNLVESSDILTELLNYRAKIKFG